MKWKLVATFCSLRMRALMTLHCCLFGRRGQWPSTSHALLVHAPKWPMCHKGYGVFSVTLVLYPNVFIHSACCTWWAWWPACISGWCGSLFRRRQISVFCSCVGAGLGFEAMNGGLGWQGGAGLVVKGRLPQPPLAFMNGSPITCWLGVDGWLVIAIVSV